MLGNANPAVNPNGERYDKLVGHTNSRLCMEHGGDQLSQSSNFLKWPAVWKARNVDQETALNGGNVGNSLEASNSAEGPQRVVVAPSALSSTPALITSAEKSDETHKLKNSWMGNGVLRTIVDKVQIHPIDSTFWPKESALKSPDSSENRSMEKNNSGKISSPPDVHIANSDTVVGATQTISSKSYEIPPHHAPGGCCCNTEQLDAIVSKVGDLHNEITSLVSEFKDQNPCNSQKNVITHKDSIPQHSQKSYNSPECSDAKAVHASPHLQKLCHFQQPLQPTPAPPVFEEKPTQIYEEKQSIKVDPSFKEDFLSYMDFVKMLKDVNQNSGTLIGGASGEMTHIKHPDEQAHHEHKKATFKDQFSKYLETYEHQPITSPPLTTEKPKQPPISDFNAKFQSLLEKFKLKL